jgi:hypothetical protein
MVTHVPTTSESINNHHVVVEEATKRSTVMIISLDMLNPQISKLAIQTTTLKQTTLKPAKVADTVDTGREGVASAEAEEGAEGKAALFNAEATEAVIVAAIVALIEEVITEAAALDITTTLIRVRVKTTMSINSPNPNLNLLQQIMS